MNGEWQWLLGRPREERKKVHIHLMGIGGTGLSAIATVLQEEGYTVSGCDRAPSALAEMLARRGVVVYKGHDAAHLVGVDLLLVSSAIPADAPERLAARARGIPVTKRDELLGRLMVERTGIAVAGTHGKTTTTGMIAWILAQAGHDPTFIVGSPLPDLGTNARAGCGPAFVVEADEYDRMFLGLLPTIAVVTNVEWDHPDCYPTLEAFQEAFAQFVARVPAGGKIIGCMDDEGVQEVRKIATMASAPTLPRAAGEGRKEARQTLVKSAAVWEGYGLEPGADWQATDVMPNARGGHDFTVFCRGVRVAQVSLSIAGKHNVLNALGALATVAQVGVEPEQAARILGFFRGAARRFEAKGEAGGIIVLDDYGHHPTEVRATLAAARQRFPGRTVWAVFQPHTFSRTRALLADFAVAFNDADHVIITDIFPARERDNLGVTSAHIVERMSHADARYIGSLDAAAAYLLQHLRAGDVLITLGAGDGYLVGEKVVGGLRKGETRRIFGDRFLADEPLARHTTFRIGGPAEWFLAAETADQLAQAVRLAKAHRMPFFILGGGSNILVADAGVEGLVIAVRCRKMEVRPDGVVYAEAGAALAGLARTAIRAGLGGLEWAVSLPGTVGGAVVGNAGAHGGCVADSLETVILLAPDGEVVRRSADWLNYSYRYSRLKGQRNDDAYIVLAAEFRLSPAPVAELEARAEGFLAQRRAAQPTEASVGSIFKNPPGDYAGRLVEAAGLKGYRVGQAQISPVHANFIVNLGGATAVEVWSLIQLARDAVQQRFGINLELEILRVGRW